MAFQQAPLPYAFDALEPHIDAKTMEIHYGKHHATYIKNLNDALADLPELASMPIDTLLQSLDKVPEAKRMAVRNNGGGHANHTFFWTLMKKGGGGEPVGNVGTAIKAAFGSSDHFKALFSEAGMKRFGSGWAWLVAAKDGSLTVESTPNQDTPVMDKKTPILGLDVWEHAYYLHYQNRRADYINAFWNVVNWGHVEELYNAAKK
ncbi:superoxide dismutase [bacterium]|jgi:superoxide dismutase, Fe-Mn family|nr:superoxide dismutase [bacterium]